MSARIEAHGSGVERDASSSIELPQAERIIEPLFSSPRGEFLPKVELHVQHLESFLAAPTPHTAAFALDSCRQLLEGIEQLGATTVKPGRAQMLRSLTLATLHQAVSVDPTPENMPFLARTLSGAGVAGRTRLDPALTAGISALNDVLSLNQLKTIASHAGPCDRCCGAFTDLAAIVAGAPVQTGQVCRERTQQAKVVAALSEGFTKVLPEAREIFSYCSPRPCLVAGFNEHVERVELILAAGKLGELCRLFPLLARDMIEAKYVIQKQVAEQDENYTIDASFAKTRPGRKPRTVSNA